MRELVGRWWSWALFVLAINFAVFAYFDRAWPSAQTIVWCLGGMALAIALIESGRAFNVWHQRRPVRPR